MFRLARELLTSVMSFASSAAEKALRLLNRVGFSGWSIVVVLVIVGACFGVIAPIGGSLTPPPPPNFGTEITQVIPSPSAVNFADSTSIPAKIEVNLQNIQRAAENKINNGGSSQKCGISKSPHNTATVARGDHIDINFDLSVTHKKCVFGGKVARHTSTGPIVVQVHPYFIDGVVKFKTDVVKTDMPRLYGVKNIRSQVKDELRSTFKSNIDDKYSFKLPEGANISRYEFTNGSNADIKLTIELLIPMPPSV